MCESREQELDSWREGNGRKQGNWHSVPVVFLLQPSVLQSKDFTLDGNVVHTGTKCQTGRKREAESKRGKNKDSCFPLWEEGMIGSQNGANLCRPDFAST